MADDTDWTYTRIPEHLMGEIIAHHMKATALYAKVGLAEEAMAAAQAEYMKLRDEIKELYSDTTKLLVREGVVEADKQYHLFSQFAEPLNIAIVGFPPGEGHAPKRTVN